MKIEMLGTPFNGLGSPPHVENPAEGLRRAGLISLLKSRGHRVDDLGDLSGFLFKDKIDPETGIKDCDIWIDLSRRLCQELGGILDREAFALLLGGDCSMLVGVIWAFAERKREVGLIFLDGHADFLGPETSKSGDPADMELAVLTGRGPEKITRVAGSFPLIAEGNIVVYGIRAWDRIRDSGIRVYERTRIAEKGIREALVEGTETFRRRGLPLWLHFDVDVLDPEFMPVMFPEPGGLSFGETREFLMGAMEQGPVQGMSIACYHPALDPGGEAGARLAGLIGDVLSV